VDLSLGLPQVDQQASEQTQDQQIREGKAIENNGFPSISTFLNTDSFDSLRTPQFILGRFESNKLLFCRTI